jgi:hypothetical protein
MCLKSSLTCSYCSKIFQRPILLPCNDTICQSHLKEFSVVKNNEITCKLCNNKCAVNGAEFEPNKAVQHLIDNENFLSDDEKNLKKVINDLFKAIQCQMDTFVSTKNKLDVECYDHFAEVRRQIEMHREKLKSQIDDIANDMCNKVDEFEKKFVKKFLNKKELEIPFNHELNLEEDMRKFNENFRNPKITIESISELKSDKDLALLDMTQKLKEINLAKENFEIHQFVKNFSFDSSSSFGHLYLFEDASEYHPFESQILNRKQQFDLVKLCEFSVNDKFELIYRGSRDGFETNDFHHNCDDFDQTLTIIQTKDDSYPHIFGGYTNFSWNGEYSELTTPWKCDPAAFIFSLTNKLNEPCKIEQDPECIQHSIFCDYFCGPTFGNPDFSISDRCDINESTCSSFQTYKRAKNISDESIGRIDRGFLAGSRSFLVNEIEVYARTSNVEPKENWTHSLM